MDRRRPGNTVRCRETPTAYGSLPAVQRAPESGDVAELGVRQHGGDLQPRGARASDQRERLTPFFLEGHPGGNLRDRPPIGDR